MMMVGAMVCVLLAGQAGELPDDDGTGPMVLPEAPTRAPIAPRPAPPVPPRRVEPQPVSATPASRMWTESSALIPPGTMQTLAVWGPRVGLVGGMALSGPLMLIPVVGPPAAAAAAAVLVLLHGGVAGFLNEGQLDAPVALAASVVLPQLGGMLVVALMTVTLAAFTALSSAAYFAPVSYDVSSQVLWGAWGVLAVGVLITGLLAVTAQVAVAASFFVLRRERVRAFIMSVVADRSGGKSR